MLFKNPIVLYALGALIVPLIVHLFYFQKFKKTPFSNLSFLVDLKQKSRKSKTLKKWLVLLSRLLLLTAIVLAFAEPYLPSKSQKKAPKDWVFYLDNSFSTQRKGSKGPLLKAAIQELAEQSNRENFPEKISVFTNNQSFEKVSFSEIYDQLLEMPYTPYQLTDSEFRVRFQKIARSLIDPALVVVSDFQKQPNTAYIGLNHKPSYAISLRSEQKKNISLDSLWLEYSQKQLHLCVKASASDFIKTEYPLAVTNGKKLLAKKQINFKTEKQTLVKIPMPTKRPIVGKVSLLQTCLLYTSPSPRDA